MEESHDFTHKLLCINLNTMLEVKSKVTQRTVHAKGHEYKQLRIFIPQDLSKDSQFPFEPGQEVSLRIDDKRLIIESNLPARVIFKS